MDEKLTDYIEPNTRPFIEKTKGLSLVNLMRDHNSKQKYMNYQSTNSPQQKRNVLIDIIKGIGIISIVVGRCVLY